jgi:DNA-binding transcriptional LysR family regulator
MDRLAAMKVLDAVVEAGSLSAAGRRLGMPLATVSRRIAELEAHLGARLINRTSRSMEPTEAGRDYHQAARRILDDVARPSASRPANTPRRAAS